MLEVLLLSLVQGITEFIPVSSSSHLVLISKFIDFEDQSLLIDVSLHIGSFLAVITYFYKDIINLQKNKKLFIKLVISSIPIMIVGYLLVQTNLIEELRNLKIIGWMTLVFGVLLFLSDKFDLDKNIDNNFNFKNAILIGFFQIISLVPGVSRSGITITAARLLKFNRYDAAKISFLLSIPTLGAVSIFGLNNIVFSNDLDISYLNITAIIFSYFFSLITIKYFLKYIKQFSLNLFIIYRMVVGIIILFFAYL